MSDSLINHVITPHIFPGDPEDTEKIELVPHIIENPGYQVDNSQNQETIHESLLSTSLSSQGAAAEL